METPRIGMSLREIGVWLSLVSTIVIAVVFFACTATGTVSGSGQIGLLIGLVIAQVTALVTIHIVLAVLRRAEQPDERDAFIELRSFRNAYFVLTFGVTMVTVGYLSWGGIASQPDAAAAGFPPPGVALLGNAVLLCFVLAEIAKAGTQLVSYRRGAL